MSPATRAQPPGLKQTPLVQVWDGLQGALQAPQFDGSEVVSTQAPLQFDSPALHDTSHCPFVHVPVPSAGDGQIFAQAPQLFTSVFSSTQSPEHALKPAVQTKPQLPAAQVGELFCGPAHTTPHVPQFDVSLAVATHEPEQFTFGAVHVKVHVPDWQVCPVGHILPQAPQLPLSEVTSTHAAPHVV